MGAEGKIIDNAHFRIAEVLEIKVNSKQEEGLVKVQFYETTDDLEP